MPFRDMGVQVILAGNMGRGSYTLLQRNNIEVLRGCSGEISEVLEDYLAGKLLDSAGSCAEHQAHSGGEHVCHHHQ